MFSKCKNLLLITIIGILILTGCSNDRTSQTYDLMPYLKMKIEDANAQLKKVKGVSVADIHISSEGGTYSSFGVSESDAEVLHITSSNGSNGNYIDYIYLDDSKKFSLMGMTAGMTAGEAIEILENNKYIFDSIFDETDENDNYIQTVFFKKNGVYQISLTYNTDEPNPYGSLDETDVYENGVVKKISISRITEDYFDELGHDVGDVAGGGEYTVEYINENCAEISTFIEDTSIQLPDIHENGMYVFGENILAVDLLPGNGYYSYVARIVINDECPYKLFDLYYGMDKESALSYLSNLGGKIRSQEDDFISYDIDDSISLNIKFTDDVVTFLECVDNYPEVHDYSGEYIKDWEEWKTYTERFTRSVGQSNLSESRSELEVDNTQAAENNEILSASKSELPNTDVEGNAEEPYENMDNHIQALYDAFVSCQWVDVYDMLEAFKKPELEETAIYITPIENVFLVIDYMPEVRSWQAYLGEVSDQKKEGRGVMLSIRHEGYSFQGVYIGEWSDNMPNGKGVLSNKIEDIEYIFEGMFLDGRYNGDIKTYLIETPLCVDWGTITPEFKSNSEWTFADMSFDDGKPIPLKMSKVDEYTEMSQLTPHELSYIKMENDGQYYYIVFDGDYNFVLSAGAKAPGEYRGQRRLLCGEYYDASNKEAVYGVPCYSTNWFRVQG